VFYQNGNQTGNAVILDALGAFDNHCGIMGLAHGTKFTVQAKREG
jgi:hypothetical protein